MPDISDMTVQEKARLETMRKTAAENAKRLNLLTLVTEFRKDVEAVRKEFGTVKDPGASWLDRHMNIYEWFKANGHALFTQMSYHPPFTPPDGDSYYQKIMALGKKYKLPFNLYYHGQMGVSAFVLTDWIIVPSANWDFIYEVVSSGGKARWIGIRAYAPLDEKEMDVARAELYKAQENAFPPEVMKSTTVSENTGNQLMFLDELVDMGKDFSGIESEKPTMASLAEDYGIAGSGAAQVKKRLQKEALELFGYGIET